MSQETNGKRQRVAVLGYGDDGRAHAASLRDRGHDVVVAVLPGGMSWVRAVKDGFRPKLTWEAVRGADVVVMLVPPSEQDLVYWEEVQPVMKRGAMLVFAHAFDLESSDLPRGADVVSVESNGGASCLITVHQDATGHARARAFEYAEGLGGGVPRAPQSHLRLVVKNDPFPHPMRRVL
jgi:ketol-acid reductoisomerase